MNDLGVPVAILSFTRRANIATRLIKIYQCSDFIFRWSC